MKRSTIALALAVLCLCAHSFAQSTRLNPHSQVNWTGAAGSGAPTIACTSANYGEPYTDTTANVDYRCGSGGWFSSQFTGGTVPGATTFQQSVTMSVAPTTPNVCTTNGYVNVMCYGAKGNGTNDDTSAIQSAINYATANHLNVNFPSVPGGCYKTTAPLILNQSATGSANVTELTLRGDGYEYNGYRSTICHALTASGPVIDVSGCVDCIIDGLNIFPLGNNPANSQATFGVLDGTITGPSNVDNGSHFTLRNSVVLASNSATGAAVAIYTADLPMIERSRVRSYNGAGLIMGNAMGTANIASTAYTLCPASSGSCNSFTKGAVVHSIIESGSSSCEPALELTGSQAYVLDDDYINTNSNCSPAVIAVGTGTTGEALSVFAHGIRTESQGNGTTTCAVSFYQYVSGGQIDGTLEDGASGSAPKVCASNTQEDSYRVRNYKFNVNGSYSTQGFFAVPYAVTVSSDPSGSCTPLANVEHSTASGNYFGCRVSGPTSYAGTWTQISSTESDQFQFPEIRVSTPALFGTISAVASGTIFDSAMDGRNTDTTSTIKADIGTISGGLHIIAQDGEAWLTSAGDWITPTTHISAAIANVQITVGTTSIPANSCTSASTVTMTGVTTSSSFFFTPPSNISSVTGWGPS